MSTTGICATPLDAPKCLHCNAALDPTLTPLTETTCSTCGQTIMVPGRLGQQYRLIRLIGAGGMGAVYEGFDDGLCRKIAVKVILREKAEEDPTFIESFRREAQAAARLNSPNIVAIYAFGEEQGQPYLVMELVQADALDKMMASGPLMPATALNICMQIAQGLKAAAEHGLVHGDVKPENILINEAREAKLADFGIAALAGASAAANNEVWGTPYYIAPETLRRQKVDLRADIYSLGGTLYHAIAGVPPFEGADAVEVMKARLMGPARPITEFRPDCPEGIAKIVMRMLEAELIRRYPNYDSLLNDMRKELRSAQSSIGGGKRIMIKGKSVTGPLVPPSAPMASVKNVNAPLVEKKSRLGLWIGLGVAGVVAVIGTVLLFLFMGADASPAPSANTPAIEATTTAQAVKDLITPAKADAKASLEATLKAVEAHSREIETAINIVENAIKTLRSNAQSLTWETDTAWLSAQTGEEQAPTPLHQNLQTAYRTLEDFKTLKQGVEQERKRFSEAVAQIPDTSLEAIETHCKTAQDAWKTWSATEAFKTYPKTLKMIQSMASGRELNAAIEKARLYRDERQKAKMREAAAAKEAELKAKLAAKEAEQAAKDLEAVKSRLEPTIQKELLKFMPETAKEEYTKRIERLRLKSTAGEQAAQVQLNRIAAIADFKTWMTQAVNHGLFKKTPGLILTDATATTLNVNGREKSWADFFNDQEVITLYRLLLIDENSARQRFSLVPSKRAELSVYALYAMDLFIGLEAREKSPTLQKTHQALQAIVTPVVKAKALLEGLQLEGGAAPDHATEE